MSRNRAAGRGPRTWGSGTWMSGYRARLRGPQFLFIAISLALSSAGESWGPQLDDARWEGGIDRNGIVDCEIGRQGGQCMVEQNCIKPLSVTQKDLCLREKMERPFLGHHITRASHGLYTCACCNRTLFRSKDKFNSQRGHVSFRKPADPGAIGYKHHEGSWLHHPRDTGIHCEYCGAHLGNVREDGPPPMGRRYSVNDVCLDHYCHSHKCARHEAEHKEAEKVGKQWRAFDRGEDLEYRVRIQVVLWSIIAIIAAIVMGCIWCCQPSPKTVRYAPVPGTDVEAQERDVEL